MGIFNLILIATGIFLLVILLLVVMLLVAKAKLATIRTRYDQHQRR